MSIGFHFDDIEEAYFKNNPDGSKSIGALSNCDIPMPQGFGEQKGWICPVCGRGLSPWTSFCPCQSDFKITYGTSTTTDIDELNELFRLNDKRVDEMIDFMKRYDT